MQTKVIVFDFDGTLSKVEKGFNCWAGLWKLLDALDVDYKYYKMYKNNEITYTEWCDIILEEFVNRGVSVDHINKVAEQIPLLEKVTEVLELLKNEGIEIYVLSGGIAPMIRKSLGVNVRYITSIEAVDFIFSENGLLREMKLCDHTLDDKQEFVKILLNRHNIEPQELLFVGNGDNDETVYLSGARTLCLNPDGANYENKQIWNDTIFSDSLESILPYVDKMFQKEDNILV